MYRNKSYKIFLGIFSFILLFGLHFFQNPSVLASTNPCGGTPVCNFEYNNTSCSQSGPMTSSTSSGQSSVSYSPGNGSYNSYTVNVSNSAPQLNISYPENCDTYAVYCTGYQSNGYVCDSNADGPSSSSTKTFTDTVSCPTTYNNSWNGVNDSASCGSGNIYFSTSPTSSTYLNGLVSNVQESCPGSYSYPVSVNNPAVKNYNDNTSGSALSGVSFSAYTSGGSLCNGTSAPTVYPDLEDSTVNVTLNQGFQAGPNNNPTEAQSYYISTSCPGGWVECSNTNVNGTFNMVHLPNNSVNSDQLPYITSNTNGVQAPLNSATLNCSLQGNSSTFYLVVDDNAVKQHPQGYAPESPMNVSPIGYIVNMVSCNTAQVHFSTSPGTPNPNDSDESVASCSVTGMVQLCATPDLDQNPYGLVLQASSNLPFNAEQYGGNPLGEIVYTIYTQCQNSQGAAVNPNDCQNNNLDGYWGLNTSGGNWLQLYAVSNGNPVPVGSSATLYIYCNNNNQNINGLYPFNPGSHSNSIGIDCQNSSTSNPVIDCVNYSCFYAQANIQNQELPSNISYSEEISISSYNNVVSSSTRSCGGNGIKNDNLTAYLNVYAPWIWTYGGNAYSNNGYNITIPPTINTGNLPNYNNCSASELAADNEYPNNNGSIISADAIPGTNSPAGNFNNAVLEQSSSTNNFEKGKGTSSNLSYTGSIGTTNSGSTPVYNFNFYVTLYCEISGQCNNPQLYNSDGSINLSKIKSTISSVSDIISSSSSSDWYFYQGNMSINSNSGSAYSGNGILLVNGNVDITPPLYPSNCSFSVSNPYSSVQSCYGLVIIASGNITIENSNPNTTGDNILNENGSLHASGSGYDIVDAFLVSMDNIIVE